MGNWKKKKNETATEIFSYTSNLALSPALNFLSFSKQFLLKIEKYENREREEILDLLVFQDSF